ncbi:MAG: carbohydrate binding family 9 domain-containing protein [Flavobacteriales bacterium]|nr:carbohydrate binding family 9 domain-containing protein [Flavobacteriales bacterium]
MKFLFIHTLLICVSALNIFAQTTKCIDIKKAKHKIILDGELNEPDWQLADPANDFIRNLPNDTGAAITPSKAFITYDDQFLYIAAICYDDMPDKKYVIQSLKRDFSFPKNDAFQVTIDPFDDRTNGFSFGVNAYGVQREGLIANGGGFGVSTDWDNKWFSKTKMYEDKWIVEMAIPFKTLRFKDNSSIWKINFSRNNLKRNETSAWSFVPRNFNVAVLNFCGETYWDTPLKKTGTNISIIPYGISRNTIDFTKNPTEEKYHLNGGGDAKIAITSSLNLDLTVNPDFSQVEVDRQVTNLSRFTLFFPEKRQFFIENNDLFGQLGFRNIRPFFSRRIGLGFNNTTGIYEQLPIAGGARLSGKINKNWRIGVLNMLTPYNKNILHAPQNYSVAVVQRKLKGNSNITAFMVNRQTLGNDTTSKLYYNHAHFNRVAGVDYNINALENRLIGKLFYHQSFNPNYIGDEGSNASFLAYNNRKWFLMWNHEYVGKNYVADVGFVPRKAIWRIEPEIRHRFLPENSFIISHSPGVYLDAYWNHSYQLLDQIAKFDYALVFNNTAEASVYYSNVYTRLTYPFDPSGTNGLTLHNGFTSYQNTAGINASSNTRKNLSVEAAANYGEYFNGNKFTVNANITYRIQPYARFTASINQDYISLPTPYSSANWTLLGTELEFSFTDQLFWNNYIQYNAQQSNLNVNSRLQWRFKPLSDLYIVYTDNYFASSEIKGLDYTRFTLHGKRNRALVVKLIYWINV